MLFTYLNSILTVISKLYYFNKFIYLEKRIEIWIYMGANRLMKRTVYIYICWYFKWGRCSKFKTPPLPVITHSFSWLETVIHHKKYFDHYSTMMKTIQNDFGDAAGVSELLQLLINVDNYKAMEWQLWWKNYKIFENNQFGKVILEWL